MVSSIILIFGIHLRECNSVTCFKPYKLLREEQLVLPQKVQRIVDIETISNLIRGATKRGRNRVVILKLNGRERLWPCFRLLQGCNPKSNSDFNSLISSLA